MIEKNMPARNRIPVRFVDEGEDADGDAARDDEATPEELGRASSYEDETEMRRRTNRGDEPNTSSGRSRADERDDAGAPRHDELPERREEQDTTDSAGESSSASSASDRSGGNSESRQASAKVSSELELIAAQAEVRMLEEELRKAKSERQELVDLVARRQADFENYRKRMERERGETYSRIAGELAKQLLPVLDNLRRAVAAESSVEGGESEEFSNFLHGVQLIERQLNGVLESLGVAPVETVGHKFDPHVHEAVAMEQTDEFEPDTITQEIQRGYRIGDRLLRPAMVKVATR